MFHASKKMDAWIMLYAWSFQLLAKKIKGKLHTPLEILRKSKENKGKVINSRSYDSVQVSVAHFGFLHSLGNLPEPGAAYGACKCCAKLNRLVLWLLPWTGSGGLWKQCKINAAESSDRGGGDAIGLGSEFLSETCFYTIWFRDTIEFCHFRKFVKSIFV